MEERFYYLVGRKLTGEASISDTEELANLLKTDEELRQLYNTLFADDAKDNEDELTVEQAFAAITVRLQVEKEMEERKLASEGNVYQPYEPHPKRKTRKRTYLVLSFLAAFAVAGFFYYRTPAKADRTPNSNEIATKNGSKSNVRLPDGTAVWLNSDSKLTYSGDFNENLREVHLSGEAYFDVVKNKTKPFIIHTDLMDIKVLGTAFNIRSYPEEETIETSLIHGSIEVILKENPAQKIFLNPSDKLIIRNTNQRKKIDSTVQKSLPATAEEQPIFVTEKIKFQGSDSLQPETAWINNKLCFDHETLEKVISKIERWYNVEFEVRNRALLSLYFTGTFENESLKHVLQALQASRHFHFQLKNEKVTVW
jgi:transmembrane sensor